MNIAPYRKLVASLVGVLVAGLNMVLELTANDDTLSSQDIVAVIVAVLIAAGVYIVPNDPTEPTGV